METVNGKKACKEKTYTNHDIERKAEELAAPIEEKSKKRRKALINNAATVISVLAIILTILLYAYNKGYCGVFNIPVDCMRFDLKSYIPVLISFVGIISYALLYSAILKIDLVLDQNRIHPMRIIFGFLIIKYLFAVSNIETLLGEVWKYLLPAILSFLLELLMFLFRGQKEEKEINKNKFEKKVFDSLLSRFMFPRILTPILFVMVVSVSFAAFFGYASAKAGTRYQICNFNDEQYAVIVSYDDRALVQKAQEDNNVLLICTSEYTFIPKEGTVFKFKQFDSVKIVMEFPEEGELPVDSTEIVPMSSAETDIPNDSSEPDTAIPTENKPSYEPNN